MLEIQTSGLFHRKDCKFTKRQNCYMQICIVRSKEDGGIFQEEWIRDTEAISATRESEGWDHGIHKLVWYTD